MDFLTNNIDTILLVSGVVFTILGVVVLKTKNKTDDKVLGFIQAPIMNFLKSIKDKKDNKNKDKKDDKKVEPTEEVEPTETEVK